MCLCALTPAHTEKYIYIYVCISKQIHKINQNLYLFQHDFTCVPKGPGKHVRSFLQSSSSEFIVKNLRASTGSLFWSPLKISACVLVYSRTLVHPLTYFSCHVKFFFSFPDTPSSCASEAFNHSVAVTHYSGYGIFVCMCCLLAALPALQVQCRLHG